MYHYVIILSSQLSQALPAQLRPVNALPSNMLHISINIETAPKRHGLVQCPSNLASRNKKKPSKKAHVDCRYGNFQKKWEPCVGVLLTRIMVYWGLHFRAPCFGKLSYHRWSTSPSMMLFTPEHPPAQRPQNYEALGSKCRVSTSRIPGTG